MSIEAKKAEIESIINQTDGVDFVSIAKDGSKTDTPYVVEINVAPHLYAVRFTDNADFETQLAEILAQ